MKRIIIIAIILILILTAIAIGLLRRKELAKSPAPVATSTDVTPVAVSPPPIASMRTASSPAATTTSTSTPVLAKIKSKPVAPPPAAPASYAHEIKVGSQILYVDISTTPAQMQLGLSDRLSMAEDQGMLFNFVTPQMPEFWMNDMNFPLDFLWVSSGTIVGITPDAPAAPRNADGSFNDSHLPLYPPPSPVDEVIEVNAGWAQKNGIVVGDTVSIID